MTPVEQQVKYTFLEYSFSPTSTPTIISPISYPAQGIAAYSNDETESSQGQRIGNKIVPQWWDYVLTVYDSTAGTESVLRIVIFEWLLSINHSDAILSPAYFRRRLFFIFFNCPNN
jgi:hypothetical protein